VKPLLDIRDLARSYRLDGAEVRALRGVSFGVRAGEFVAVRGPSGGGKSTLLHVVGLLATPDAGEYLFDGRDVSALRETERAALRNRRIGFVFQQFNLLPRATVLDNVALPAVYRQGRPDRRRARECLEAVGVADLADRRPNQLSGGQQQRVAIARALLHEPALLLADEPTGNLDSASAATVLAAIEDLHRRGTTVLMVTHEADVAARAPRQIELRDGRIVSDSAPPPAAPAAEDRATPLEIPRAGPPPHRLLAAHFRQAVRSLRTHAARAGLSALGVFVGTFALMATVLLLSGAQETVRRQLEGLGTNLLVVAPAADAPPGRAPPRLTLDDARAAAALPGVRAASGLLLGAADLAAEGRPARATPLIGAEAALGRLSNGAPAAGRFFTADEVEREARVVVLGATPARALFGRESPLGRTLTINGVAFRVVGLMPERGVNPWRDADDLAAIPITVAQKRVLGRPDVDQVQIEAARPDLLPDIERRMRDALALRRPSDPAAAAAFRFRDLSRIRRTFEDVAAILSGLLISVSAISLLVGGIGIMNVMLVAVTERTREIGLRKALGARVGDIRAQFLIEAVLLSGLGGAAGVAAGGVALRLSGGFGAPPNAAAAAAGLAFAAAAATGIVFGLWPAWRAARREPVAALRYE